MSAVDQAAPELLPCPLCGAELDIEGDGYEHPASDDCPLDSLYLEARHAAGWNRREAADMAECAAFSAGYEAGEAGGRADLAAPSAQPAHHAENSADLLRDVGMDGAKWAAAFKATAEKLGHGGMDEGWLIGWFCNAVMAGYDEAERRHREAAPSAPADVEGLVDALRSYQQADMDGVIVKVSRQACEEAATALNALQARAEKAEDERDAAQKEADQIPSLLAINEKRVVERDEARAAKKAAYERAAKVADDEAERILSKQDGKEPSVDLNLRFIALMLPEVAETILALATEADTTALAEMLDAEARACAEVIEHERAKRLGDGHDAASTNGMHSAMTTILARIDQRKEAGA